MAKEYFVKEEDIDVLKDNVDNKISSPNTAEVGQILSVKAIDGNGKPTEWEVIDKPGSGPGESSPYIYMTQEEYEALEEYEQDRMYWVTYPCGDWLVWQNGEAILGQGVAQSWGIKLNPSSASYPKITILFCKILAIGFNTFVDSLQNSLPYLEKCDIAKGVTSIGEGTFYDCSTLKSITIPNTVTSIGNRAFYNYINLANIYYKGTEEQWSAISKGAEWKGNMGSNVTGGTVIHYNYTG